MNNAQATVKALEKQYSLNIGALLEDYKEGATRAELATSYNCTEFVVRQILDKLGLPFKKSKRGVAYTRLIESLAYASKEDMVKFDDIIEENEYIHKQLNLKDRALQRSRDEANYLRKITRENNRTVTLEDKVEELIKQALPISYEPKTINVKTITRSDKYSSHVSSIILSDIHAEETVEPRDVGLLNKYNWGVMERRIEQLFSEWLNMYRGESRGVIFILGDVISGIIHNILESTSKPTAEAVHDLADMLNSYIRTSAMLFDTVDIHFVSGNHERITEHVKSNNKGFDFGYLFAQILKAKLDTAENVSMNISTTGYIATEIGGKWVGGHHGDMHRGAKSEARTFRIQEGFKSILGVDVHHIFEGHTHKFSYHLTNRGASICNGSVIGSNAYGTTNGFTAITANQTIVQFLPNGEIEAVRCVLLS